MHTTSATAGNTKSFSRVASGPRRESGLLYAWLVTGRQLFVYSVPVGGISFIIGWVLLAIGAFGSGQW
jgi:uncharacterized membrane protein YgdD (TMEM256/DUF423 family)